MPQPGGVANFSDVIALDDLSEAGRKELRDAALMAVIQAEMSKTDKSADGITARGIWPGTDLGLTGHGATSGTGGSAPAYSEAWIFPTAGTAGTELSYINQQLTERKCITFYGVTSGTATPSTSRLRFVLGPTGATVKAGYQLQKIWTRENPVGYFSNFTLFVYLDTIQVKAMPWQDFPANTEELEIMGYVAEGFGEQISAPIS